MKFKEWLLEETGTSTCDIAGYKRMTIPLVRRVWPQEVNVDLLKGKKKKPYKQPQVEE